MAREALPRRRHRRISLAAPRSVSSATAPEALVHIHFLQEEPCPACLMPCPAAGILSGTSSQHPHLPGESGPHGQGKELCLEQTIRLAQTLSQGEGPLGWEV